MEDGCWVVWVVGVEHELYMVFDVGGWQTERAIEKHVSRSIEAMRYSLSTWQDNRTTPELRHTTTTTTTTASDNQRPTPDDALLLLT